jgi:hypothetical protein
MDKNLDNLITEQLRIVDSLDRLTDKERMEIFSCYCCKCGMPNPKCQCWNDE